MADKMTCPACDVHLSAVLAAYLAGNPCPGCGLPAEAAEAVLRAQERGANEQLMADYMAAEKRAAEAEEQVRQLLATLDGVRAALQRLDWKQV